MFVTHTEQVIAELERTSDKETWKQWTHTLKGSARGIGAFAVADAAAEAEANLMDKSKLEPLTGCLRGSANFIGRHPL